MIKKDYDQSKRSTITIYGDHSHAVAELVVGFENKGYTVEKISTADPDPIACHGSFCVSGHNRIRSSFFTK